MKIKNWTPCARDREKWKKEVVEKAKLSAIKECSVPGRREDNNQLDIHSGIVTVYSEVYTKYTNIGYMENIQNFQWQGK